MIIFFKSKKNRKIKTIKKIYNQTLGQSGPKAKSSAYSHTLKYKIGKVILKYIKQCHFIHFRSKRSHFSY